MAPKRHVPKFHRATPAVRREALVDATLSCLKQYGHEGVSVRRISAAAGVSIGLINHHFPSKSGLVAEAYETLAISLQDSIHRQADAGAGSPRERLSGFIRASFALSALLDGLWVELSLSSSAFKPREAIALCEDWVTALCNGCFPWLLRGGVSRKKSSAAAPR